MGVPDDAENAALPLDRQDTGISYVGPDVKPKGPELPLAFIIPSASPPNQTSTLIVLKWTWSSSDLHQNHFKSCTSLPLGFVVILTGPLK